MAEVLTVLTFKSAHHIVRDGGTQSWVISQRRARRCAYVVCVRHQQGPYKAEGNEPHKHAFLVGKVSDVVPSSETQDRFRVEMSEYAIVEGPSIPLNSASPTQYFPSLSNIGIDEASLKWKPLDDLPGEEPAPANGAMEAAVIDEGGEYAPSFTTIAQVMGWARERVAEIAGVQIEAVKLDLKVEY